VANVELLTIPSLKKMVSTELGMQVSAFKLRKILIQKLDFVWEKARPQEGCVN
jgi:hypothetical protein